MEPITIEDVKTTVGAELTAFRTEMPKLVGEAIAEAMKDLPDRRQAEKLLGGDPDLKPAGSGARVIDPRAHLYERMKRTDPELAQWRSPDSDHWAAEWIRGSAMGDHSRMARAGDEIGKIYRRATLTEGTTTASRSLHWLRAMRRAIELSSGRGISGR